MPIQDDSKIQVLRGQIFAWGNRAAMAYQHSKIELSKIALNRRWQHQRELAELEGTKAPDAPQEPEDFFRGLDRGGGPGAQNSDPGFGPSGRNPNQPARVPRRPLPNAGAGEVALPVPKQSSENET